MHGAANAMYLPRVIQFNAKVPEAASRYAEIARFIGLSGETDEELTSALIHEIQELNRKLSSLPAFSFMKAESLMRKNF